MTYIGIDPGKSGSLAVIMQDGNIQIVPFDESRYREILHYVSGLNDGARCCLERVGAMPGQGVSSMFNFGDNFGFIRGILSAYWIPYQLVRPQTWKKEFEVTEDKNTSIAVCKRLFPGVSLYRTERSRKEDDNMAESLLMAEYARRKM